MSDEKIKTAAGKAPTNLIPVQSLQGAARVFGYGAKKYAPGNYYNAHLDDGAGGRYIGAALRHLAEMQHPNGLHTPESLAALDEESGLPHIDHVLCGLMMLRSIMVKCGALPVDPGVGKEPTTVAQREAEKVDPFVEAVEKWFKDRSKIRLKDNPAREGYITEYGRDVVTVMMDPLEGRTYGMSLHRSFDEIELVPEKEDPTYVKIRPLGVGSRVRVTNTIAPNWVGTIKECNGVTMLVAFDGGGTYYWNRVGLEPLPEELPTETLVRETRVADGAYDVAPPASRTGPGDP